MLCEHRKMSLGGSLSTGHEAVWCHGTQGGEGPVACLQRFLLLPTDFYVLNSFFLGGGGGGSRVGVQYTAEEMGSKEKEKQVTVRA